MINETPAQTGFDIEIRPIGEHEITAWDRALMRGFLSPHEGDGTEVRRRQFVPGRWLAAVDHATGGAFVGTYRSYDLELTLPGGAAVLIASEYPVYGRFGFGPATRMAGLTVDVPRSGGLRPGLRTPAGGRIDFATPEEVRTLGPDLYDRWRLAQPGALSRPDANWAMDTGEVVLPARGWKEPFFAVHRDAAGVVTGLAVYRVDDKWIGMAPDSTLQVMDFLALDRPTANALWRLLFSVDWVQRIEVEDIGPDDPLPLLLANPRAATPHVSQTDFTWLRLLNLPAAFAARAYAGSGRVVLGVTDPLGWTSGSWLLETASDGTGRCTPTGSPADLTLGVSELSTLYLGTESACRLLAAGLLAEDTPGAAASLDHLLHTPMRAWNTLTV
ncbi:sterol carrier protein domain-containing protein [Streptomyces erythrochromogenes]|uniref:sterol carrier protein domain-containing protein n=1 Tax=Streptomyces erythrochromogenes TaxID=285574 RepID=UPI00343DBB8A